MGILKKIVHFLSIIIYLFIAAYAVVCIPLVLGYKPVVVLSGSMEPTYKTGSVIYYKSVPQEELKVGDTITFTSKNNNLVSHRIVSIENGLYETKGDANNVSDMDKVSYENIKGKVYEKSIPYVGNYIKEVNKSVHMIIIVSVIILISEFILSNVGTKDINNNKVEGSEN